MQGLSNELGLAISTLTRIVDILVRDEFIHRYSNDQDRRKVYLELTEKGKEMAKKLKDCSEEFWYAIYNRIPNNKKTRIIEDLEILYNILEEMEKKCCTNT